LQIVLVGLTFAIKRLSVRLYNLFSIYLFTPLVLVTLTSYSNELFILIIVRIDQICFIFTDKLRMRELILLFILDIA